MQAIINTQVNLIQKDGCTILKVVDTRNQNALILYSTRQGYDIFARIVYPTGVSTKRYLNDLAMFVKKKPGENAYSILYIRIIGDKMNSGYGTIMMNELLSIARDKQIDYIDGHMQDATSQEHDSRLRHYYTKFGFRIDEERNLLWKRDPDS
ncbi:hypothetical protein ACFPYJ_14415 [Paenibacillus solisilvae]|uniref:N-acetyltransferase domain-containing protein n=1 Tax=Paenibacillus solisilvae TaxID=2486751 RepID=A0ABW0VWQ1_9BACL